LREMVGGSKVRSTLVSNHYEHEKKIKQERKDGRGELNHKGREGEYAVLASKNRWRPKCL